MQFLDRKGCNFWKIVGLAILAFLFNVFRFGIEEHKKHAKIQMPRPLKGPLKEPYKGPHKDFIRAPKEPLRIIKSLIRLLRAL